MRSLHNDALILRMLAEKKRNFLNNKSLDGNSQIYFLQAGEYCKKYDTKLLHEKNFIERVDSVKKLVNIWSSRFFCLWESDSY